MLLRMPSLRPADITGAGIAFLSQDEGSDDPVNGIVARLVEYYQSRSRFPHCEIAFFYSDCTKITAVRVDTGGVYLIERNFSAEAYKLFRLKLDATQISAMCNFCNKCLQADKTYDNFGAMISPLWPRKADSPGWWCSSFAATALQMAGFLTNRHANSLSTEDIFDLLQAENLLRSVPKPTDFKKLQDVTMRLTRN